MKTIYGSEITEYVILGAWENLVIFGDEAGEVWGKVIPTHHRVTTEILQAQQISQENWLKRVGVYRDEDGVPFAPLRVSEVAPLTFTMQVYRPIRSIGSWVGEHPYDLDDRIERIPIRPFLIRDEDRGTALEVFCGYDRFNRAWYRSGPPQAFRRRVGWFKVEAPAQVVDQEPRGGGPAPSGTLRPGAGGGDLDRADGQLRPEPEAAGRGSGAADR